MDETKPHKGRIERWSKFRHPNIMDKGLGYIVEGTFLDHERIRGRGLTSYVTAHEGAEIETRNSRYTLVGEEVR